MKFDVSGNPFPETNHPKQSSIKQSLNSLFDHSS